MLVHLGILGEISNLIAYTSESHATRHGAYAVHMHTHNIYLRGCSRPWGHGRYLAAGWMDLLPPGIISMLGHLSKLGDIIKLI